VDRLLLLLPSNATTLTDGDRFIFSAEHLFYAVSSPPLLGEFRPRPDDNVANTGASPPLVQFNISSTSSGRQQHCN